MDQQFKVPGVLGQQFVVGGYGSTVHGHRGGRYRSTVHGPGVQVDSPWSRRGNVQGELIPPSPPRTSPFAQFQIQFRQNNLAHL